MTAIWTEIMINRDKTYRLYYNSSISWNYPYKIELIK